MNNLFDQLMRSMVRGFGWTIGRRAANRVPLWLAIPLIVAMWYFGGRH